MKKSRILELLAGYESNVLDLSDQNAPARLIFVQYLAWSFSKDGNTEEFLYLPTSFATHVVMVCNMLRISEEQEILIFRGLYLEAMRRLDIDQKVTQIGNLLDLSSDQNSTSLMTVIEQSLKEVFGFGQGSLYFSTINTQIEATALALKNSIISFVTEVWMKGLGNIACKEPEKKRLILLSYIRIQIRQIDSKIELQLTGSPYLYGGEISMQFDCNLDTYIMPGYSIDGKSFSLSHVLYLLEEVIQMWSEYVIYDTYQHLDIRYVD